MFYVMENNLAAIEDDPEFSGFDSNVFNNFEDAYDYLVEWVRPWGECSIPPLEDFEVGVEYYYNGYDHVSIEED